MVHLLKRSVEPFLLALGEKYEASTTAKSAIRNCAQYAF
jgi:hypothetical protein